MTTMAQPSHHWPAALPVPVVLLSLLSAVTSNILGLPIIQLVNITAGKPTIRNGGTVIDLRLDQFSASGFQSKQLFLFARVDMQMKLPPNDTAGTVTTFYLSSGGIFHDEVDFEFLGNLNGDPYILHTNIYAQGKGDREMQFFLWFDPRVAFHTYTVLWNPQFIILYVDEQPIRVFPNLMGLGIPFPYKQAMKVYASIWNADWATQGGRVQINWSHAPFVASYANLSSIPCPTTSNDTLCKIPLPGSLNGKVPQLDSWTNNTIHTLQAKYMIYNYCADTKRFPQGLPPECSVKF